MIKAFGLNNQLVIGFDDHLERRGGKKITAKGIYRDAVRSSESFFVKASGLRWMSFMLLTEAPFAGRIWALPFLTILCPSEKYHQRRGIRHRKLTDRARQAILQIARWFPALELIFVGDSSYAALDLLNAVREKAVLVTRLRLDAALYEPVPAQQKRQPGRPRKKGKRLENLSEMVKNPQTQWKKVAVKLVWSGKRDSNCERQMCLVSYWQTSRADSLGNNQRPVGKV